jgi:PAS domain S-box-containing protein
MNAEGTELSLQELTAIFETASVGILLLRNGRIARCNGRAAEVFGLESASLLQGCEASVLDTDSTQQARLGRVAAPLASHVLPFHGDWIGRRSGGALVWCSAHGRLVEPQRPERGAVWVVEDVTAARKLQREMEAIMRNAPVGIVFTRERRIVRHNARWAEMFGFEGDEAVGLPAAECFLSAEHYEELGRRAGPLLSAGKPFQTELFMRRRDGQPIWVSVIGYVQDPADPPAGTIWLFEDRHDARQAAQDLREARDRAEAANLAKSSFLANMSHELRTPLNAVLGYAQLLQLRGTADAAQTQAALDTIRKSGEHLLALINDVLDLSRIEAGKMELHASVVELEPFLQTVLDIVRVRAQPKQLPVLYEALGELPRRVRADAHRLRQVLLNLLGNAVKFTAQGSVLLRVQGRLQDGDRVALAFEVADTGPGIPVRDMEAIFLPFEQAGDAEQRAGGTGLGLPISRELVRAMGGELQARSRVGEGSTFSFEVVLPVAGEPITAANHPQAVTGYLGARRRVLLVDDIAANRQLLADLLGHLGFEVAQASNGEEGVQRAQELRPDLVLMDNVMPVMGGHEATRRLRGVPGLESLPIIALSASASAAERARSLEVGANGFLAKPVVLSRLVEEIGRLLQLQWTVDERL